MTTKLSQKIINTIKAKHLKPKPKIYFYLSSLLFGFALAASFILAMFFLNLFFFYLFSSGRTLPCALFILRPLPLLYFCLTLILLLISTYLLSKNQYRHSLLAVFFDALLFVFTGHFLISSLRPHQRFPRSLRRLYQYRQLPSPPPPRYLWK